MNVAMIGLRAPGQLGGVEQVVAALGPRLVRLGCKVTVYCRSRYNAMGGGVDGMQLVDVPAVYTKHLEAITHTALGLTRLIASGRHDLVHIHAAGPALLSAVPRRFGLPTVVTLHAADWKRDKWGPIARLALRLGARSACRHADRVIAVSPDVARQVSREDIEVIPNGVDPIPVTPLATAAVAGLQPGYFLILGRIVPEKALETAILAHRCLQHPRPPLVITGGAQHAAGYLRQLKRVAAADVHFTGARFGAAKHALFHHAAAVLFPSRLEGLPLGVLEAMSVGQRVIASDIAPHRLLLRNRGALLPVDDHDSWSSALDDLCPGRSSAWPWLEWQAAARRHVRSHYSWDPLAERTLSVYRSALRARESVVVGRRVG